MKKLSDKQKEVLEALVLKMQNISTFEQKELKKLILSVNESLNSFMSELLNDSDNVIFNPNALSIKDIAHYAKKYAFLRAESIFESVIGSLHEKVWEIRESEDGIENYPYKRLIVNKKVLLSAQEIKKAVKSGIDESIQGVIRERLNEMVLIQSVGERVPGLLGGAKK